MYIFPKRWYFNTFCKHKHHQIDFLVTFGIYPSCSIGKFSYWPIILLDMFRKSQKPFWRRFDILCRNISFTFGKVKMQYKQTKRYIVFMEMMLVLHLVAEGAVRKRFARFKSGDFNVKNQERSSRSSIVNDEQTLIENNLLYTRARIMGKGYSTCFIWALQSI